MADEGKTLGQLVADLQQEYGEHHYGRIDLHIPNEIKQAALARTKALKAGDMGFGGMTILRQETNGRDQVLPGQSRGEDQAQGGGDVDPAASERYRAAAAHLCGVVLEGDGAAAAGIGTDVCAVERALARVSGR